MVVIAEGLPVKKQFLQRAFFPLGTQVCKEIGLVPPSEDVAESEQHQAYHELMAAGEEWGEFLRKRVEWYVQGLEALHSSGIGVTERELPDHIAAFAAAVMVDERYAQ